MIFEKDVKGFIQLAAKHQLRMLMVGGGAVNFHGYRRHSADVDFWINITEENLIRLKAVLSGMKMEVDDFPVEVKRGQQNISLKISPVQEIELITNFNPGKSFEEAWTSSVKTSLPGIKDSTYHVLHFDDLVESKLRSARPKDLLDIQELKRIRNGNQDQLKEL